MAITPESERERLIGHICEFTAQSAAQKRVCRMSRPRGAAGAGASMTFTEISRRTGIPRSTTYAAYRRVEEKFVIAWLVRYVWKDEPARKLAAA